MNEKDRVFAEPRPSIEDFVFDERVAKVFPDMIRRSVPGYALTIETIGSLAAYYVQPGSTCYDLGCSLGAATLAMRGNIQHNDCRIVAVDNAPAMVARCRETIAQQSGTVPVEVRCADLRDMAFSDTSMVVMNFTLQFIDPSARQGIVNRIFQSLRPGGIFVLSEKLAFANPQVQALQNRLHLAFKRANGYSDMEIAQKRAALEDVLIPDTLAAHEERLAQAGFSSNTVLLQFLNFACLLAKKADHSPTKGTRGLRSPQ